MSTGLANSAWPKFGHDSRNTGQSPYNSVIADQVTKWSYTTGAIIYSSPAIGADGTIYVGSLDYKLYALTYTGTTGGTGTVKWSYTTGNAIYGAPAIGNDGTIYVGSSDTNLYAFSPTGTTGTTGGNSICFLKGTYILTTDGDVLVEDLTENHKVITHGNIENEKLLYEPTSSRVKKMIHFTAYNLGQFGRPICFKQGVAGHMMPNRDLYISPLHMVLVGDKMYQAHQLLNGTTIAYDMTCSSAEYYHIVLEKHSVIYSNNMATESCSYVDYEDNRYESNPISASNMLTVS